MKNILNWRAALSPSAHLLYKRASTFPKVFRRSLILDIFFVHFLRFSNSFATSIRENNKINSINKIQNVRAYMVSSPRNRRKVQKRAQKKAPGAARIRGQPGPRPY